MNMEYVTLANGLQVPKIGLGMWNTYEGEAAKTVETAVRLGYRRIDTAMGYKNEAEVGEGIRKSGVPREEIFISTKIWWADMVDKDKAHIRATFEKSLSNLGTDYVDMYMIHWPVGDVKAAWEVLEELYAEGKAKSIGVCNFQKHHLEDLLAYAKVKPMINQIESHPTFTQDELFQYTKSLGIQPEIWSPLGRGADLQNETVGAIAEKYGKSPAQVMLRWHIQRGATTIPKSVHEERMIQNADIFDFALTDEEMAALLAEEAGTPCGNYKQGDYSFTR